MSDHVIAIAALALALVMVFMALIGLGVAVLAVSNHPDRARVAKVFFAVAAVAAMLSLAALTVWVGIGGLICVLDLVGLICIFWCWRAGCRFANRSSLADLGLPSSAFISESVLVRVRTLIKDRCYMLYTHPYASFAVFVLVAAVFGALAFCVIRAVVTRPGPASNSAFATLRNKYNGELGAALDEGGWVSWVYHGQHENAIVIAPSNEQRIYLLYDEDLEGNKKLVVQRDEGVTKVDNYWLKDGEVAKKFVEKFGEEKGKPLTGDQHVPYGMVAKGWFGHPEQFQGIGWRTDHCWYEVDKVYMQRFENGLIVGSLRHIPRADDAQYGSVFVLLTREHKWDSIGDTTNPLPLPPCQTPRDS